MNEQDRTSIHEAMEQITTVSMKIADLNRTSACALCALQAL